MKEIGRYDTELQMFVEEPKPVKIKHLGMLRFIAEKRAQQEGRSIFPPSGELAFALAIKVDDPVEEILSPATKNERVVGQD